MTNGREKSDPAKNPLHWTLDVTFQEDLSRVRKGHGAQNNA